MFDAKKKKDLWRADRTKVCGFEVWFANASPLH